MPDIAVLALQVDATQVPAATQELNKLTEAGTRAEASTQKLGRTSISMGQSVSTSAGAATSSFRATAAAQADATRAAEVNAAAQRQSNAAQAQGAAVQAEVIALTRAQAAASVANAKAASQSAVSAQSNAAAQVRAASASETATAAFLEEIAATKASAAALRQREVALNASTVASERAAASGAKAAAGLFALSGQSRALTAVLRGGLPAIAGMATALVPLLIGSAVITGVLAGLKAVGDAWHRMGEDARQAKERTAEAIAELKRLDEARNIAARGGPEQAAVNEARKGADGLDAKAAEIARLEAQIRSASAPQGASKRLEQLRSEYAELLALVGRQEQAITLEQQEAARERAQKGREADAANQRRIREAGEVEKRILEERAKAAADAYAKLQRDIDPSAVWAQGIGAGLRAIGELQAAAEKLELAAPLERGVKAAQEMRAEAAKLRETLAAVQAAMPGNVRRALDPNTVTRRAPDFVGAAAANNLSNFRITPRDPGANEAADRKRREDDVRAFENAHASGIRKGFEAARSTVKDIFKNAFDGVSIGKGVGEFIGQAATGFAVNLAGQAASRLVEGLRGLFGESESERLAKENQAVMRDLISAIEEWGNKVTQLSTTDVTRFSAFSDAQQRFKVDERGPRLTGEAERQARDLETFFGFDFGESINPEEWNQLLEAWNRAFAEAQRIVNQQLDQEIGRRRAALSGNTDEVARIDAGAARDEQLRRASDLLSKGLIDVARFMDLAALAGEEYQKVLDDIAKAQTVAAEALARERAALEGDLQVRLLAAQGRDKEAEALRRQLAQQEEMRQAIEKYGESIRFTVQATQDAENAAFDEAEARREQEEADRKASDAAREAADAAERAAQSIRDMARAAAELQAMADDFNVRTLQLNGDERGAFVAQQEIRGRNELQAKREFFEAQGLTGVDLIRALAPWIALVSNEFTKALGEFDARAAQEAQRNQAVPPSTNVANEAALNAQVATEAMSFATVSDSTANEIRIIERSQLAVLKSIDNHILQFGRGTPAQPTTPPPVPVSVSAPAITVDTPTVQVPPVQVPTVRIPEAPEVAVPDDSTWRDAMLRAQLQIEQNTLAMSKGTFGVPAPDFTQPILSAAPPAPPPPVNVEIPEPVVPEVAPPLALDSVWMTSMLRAEVQTEEHTRMMLAALSRPTFPSFSVPDFSRSTVAPTSSASVSSRPTVQITIGDVYLDGVKDTAEATAMGRAVGRGIIAEVNDKLGPAFDFDERMSGKNEL